MSIKKLRSETFDMVCKNHNNLRFKDLGRSEEFNDYSRSEIEEMFYGIYKDTKHLLVDGDYFIKMDDVIQAGCIVETVSCYKKAEAEYTGDTIITRLQNIRTFYVKDYFLVTKNKVCGFEKHLITRFLYKTGAIKKGEGSFRNLYRISNLSKELQNFKAGLFPVDLYSPIKLNINQLFFNEDNRISDFVVEYELPIKFS